MALTLEIEQRLVSAGLTQFFERNRREWVPAARETYEFMMRTFPDGAPIRPDDVRKILLPIIEVDQRLQAELNRRKLTQKYWVGHFTDLIIERAWNEIRGANQ
jgi:hypothetical protein